MPTRSRVLVVEDEWLPAIGLCDTLSAIGFKVVGPASTVHEALGLLETEQPDIALLDENLAGTQVTPVAEMLKRHHIPFAIVSGYSRPRTNDKVLLEAPRVEKPASAATILDLLDRIDREAGTGPSG